MRRFFTMEDNDENIVVEISEECLPKVRAYASCQDVDAQTCPEKKISAKECVESSAKRKNCNNGDTICSTTVSEMVNSIFKDEIAVYDSECSAEDCLVQEEMLLPCPRSMKDFTNDIDHTLAGIFLKLDTSTLGTDDTTYGVCSYAHPCNSTSKNYCSQGGLGLKRESDTCEYNPLVGLCMSKSQANEWNAKKRLFNAYTRYRFHDGNSVSWHNMVRRASPTCTTY